MKIQWRTAGKFAVRYLQNWILLLDLAVNTLTFGDPEETISSRLGKAETTKNCKVCKWICKALDLVDKRHCAEAFNPHEGSGSDDNQDLILDD